MIPILLKPNFYSIRNELNREYKTRFWNRTTFACLFVAFILYGMYSVSLSFFLKLKSHQLFSESMISSFISVSLLALLSVTSFSAIISALGALFSSKELHTLLSAPIPLYKIFVAKFIHVYFLATWMFLLVAISFGLGFQNAFHIPIDTSIFWLFNFLLCSLIPSSFGIICVIIFANIVPAERLREVIILTVIIGLFMVLSADHQTSVDNKLPESFAKAIAIANKFSLTQFEWLPSTLLANIMSKSMLSGVKDYKSSLFIIAFSLGSILLSFLIFKLFFLRGWAKSTNSNVQRISYKSDLLGKVGNFFFREASTYRAFAGKEFRSFLRDTTQSVQLLLLLTLTFIYLYNFKVMHSGTIINDSFREIWNIVLSSANILFGGCVTAAICTRFVFPCISLEGVSFQIIRSTPVSIKDFIRAKYLTWFFPVTIVSLVLFISGSLAVSADFEIILSSCIIAISFSSSSVALAIGAGSLYAKFNWDNPIQVISSFGSLAYMFMAMVNLFINLIPTTILFAICYSEYIRRNLLFVDRTFAIAGLIFTIIILNAIILKRSLIAAENYLEKNENIY